MDSQFDRVDPAEVTAFGNNDPRLATGKIMHPAAAVAAQMPGRVGVGRLSLIHN